MGSKRIRAAKNSARGVVDITYEHIVEIKLADVTGRIEELRARISQAESYIEKLKTDIADFAQELQALESTAR